MFTKALTLLAVCSLLSPMECSWLGDIGRKIKSGLEKVGTEIKNAGQKVINYVESKVCEGVYGIVCPKAIKLLGKFLDTGSKDFNDAIIAAGVVAGTNACHVKKSKCKRSVDVETVTLAFSDDVNDYDINGDKLVVFEEFMYAVMRSVNLADPQELREPFDFADANRDGVLDTDEFNGAPFLFAHATRHEFVGRAT
ncbi:uncharacterized protein LOC127851413 [Dreissena polymorpha]|uniref:EF-hand domain-containing protein n=1 Tax=Dreissena polymorpha TaxID=45954 RepID=A0A9D4HXU0_DREPO|nr:uncharacterized protein LOC127851413 [Dreissena polymorpha]KAH3736733.1 hypothetical protein DPMN_043306 [Dreissena polymorpha]